MKPEQSQIGYASFTPYFSDLDMELFQLRMNIQLLQKRIKNLERQLNGKRRKISKAKNMNR